MFPFFHEHPLVSLQSHIVALTYLQSLVQCKNLMLCYLVYLQLRHLLEFHLTFTRVLSPLSQRLNPPPPPLQLHAIKKRNCCGNISIVRTEVNV